LAIETNPAGSPVVAVFLYDQNDGDDAIAISIPYRCYRYLAGPEPWPHRNRRYDQYTGFINITIVGERFYQHNYFLYPAPPADFCERWANSTVKNVIGNGTW
jgi:hypothetical protein